MQPHTHAQGHGKAMAAVSDTRGQRRVKEEGDRVARWKFHYMQKPRLA